MQSALLVEGREVTFLRGELVPLASVDVYVSERFSCTASYSSSVLMSCASAKIASVKSIYLCCSSDHRH
ncbi:MAG: histidinol dehydrogenase [Candidatus Hodgkinia cicadicola]